jgi:hypothetical protein
VRDIPTSTVGSHFLRRTREADYSARDELGDAEQTDERDRDHAQHRVSGAPIGISRLVTRQDAVEGAGLTVVTPVIAGLGCERP